MRHDDASTCTDETHAAARADVAVWTTLTYKGVWVFDPEDGEPPTRSEVRDCPRCGGTLLRELSGENPTPVASR